MKAAVSLQWLAGTAAIGIAAGSVAVAFHSLAGALFSWIYAGAATSPWWAFAATAAGACTLGALASGWLMQRYAPDAAGSGIPQVKVAYAQGQPLLGWPLVLVKFFGGVLAIGTGSSLGREGPTIHLGAALGTRIARGLQEPAEARAVALCAGSAAGLAAAFNSPLAGVALVVEEIAGGKDMERYTGRCLIAAALAVGVVLLLQGNHPALPVSGDLNVTPAVVWLVVPTALLAAAAGVLFQYSTLRLRGWMKQDGAFLGFVRPGVGAAVAAVIGLGAFAATGRVGVFGLGEQDIVGALNGEILWHGALVLLLAKLAATALCYGSGGCGGIFAPILYFGSMAGICIGGSVGMMANVSPEDISVLAMIGMTACLGAVVRAPLTSILIVMEMTMQIHVLPLLMVAAVVGELANRWCFRRNFYDAALEQDGIRSL